MMLKSHARLLSLSILGRRHDVRAGTRRRPSPAGRETDGALTVASPIRIADGA